MLLDIQATIVLPAPASAPAQPQSSDGEEEWGGGGLEEDAVEGARPRGARAKPAPDAAAGDAAAAVDGMKRVAEFVAANERHLGKVAGLADP
jgi:hypothetical protein